MEDGAVAAQPEWGIVAAKEEGMSPMSPILGGICSLGAVQVCADPLHVDFCCQK